MNAYQATFGTGPSAPTVTYRWPIKPFNRAHQIRATFGEPRSTRLPRNGLKGYDWHAYLYTLNQVSVVPRTIHDGIDIVVPKGTPVYAIQSGRVELGGHGRYGRWARIGDFRYDHIAPSVKRGQKAVALRTVIGRIATPDNHLHLTRAWRGKSINPLSHGGMVGFTDTTAPQLKSVNAYTPEGQGVDMQALRGKVALTIHMDDLLSDGGAGVGVYRYGYQITASDGSPAVGPYDVYQADRILPAQAADRLYGVASNRNDFDHDFWYRLTLRSPSGDGTLDTDQMAPGSYTLTVTASDASGNTTSADYPLTVAPR